MSVRSISIQVLLEPLQDFNFILEQPGGKGRSRQFYEQIADHHGDERVPQQSKRADDQRSLIIIGKIPAGPIRRPDVAHVDQNGSALALANARQGLGVLLTICDRDPGVW